MTTQPRCSFCHIELYPEDTHTLDDTIMCESCYNNETTTCEDCETRIWREDSYGGDHHTFCESCYEDYNHCTACNRLIHRNDTHYEHDDSDDPFCADCLHERSQHRVIHTYDYKPDPVLHGSGFLFLGVELEIDEGGERQDNAQALLDIANAADDNMYIKHDGSLDNGFELVSHPMLLHYHQTYMPWRQIFDKAVSLDYRSHQTATCGLHIHVNRSAFGKKKRRSKRQSAGSCTLWKRTGMRCCVFPAVHNAPSGNGRRGTA